MLQRERAGRQVGWWRTRAADDIIVISSCGQWHMANTTVRNIPDELYSSLRREAQGTGGSLNSEILAAIRDRVEILRQRRRRSRAIAEINRLRAEIARKYPVQTDSVQLIRADRDRR